MRKFLIIGAVVVAVLTAGVYQLFRNPPRNIKICGASYHELSSSTFRPRVLIKQKVVRIPEDVFYVTGSCSQGAKVALGPRMSYRDTLGITVLARDKNGDPTAIVTMDTGVRGQGLFVYPKGQREIFVGTP